MALPQIVLWVLLPLGDIYVRVCPPGSHPWVIYVCTACNYTVCILYVTFLALLLYPVCHIPGLNTVSCMSHVTFLTTTLLTFVSRIPVLRITHSCPLYRALFSTVSYSILVYHTLYPTFLSSALSPLYSIVFHGILTVCPKFLSSVSCSLILCISY